MSVKVAVRVRPFNPREIELGSKLCVSMAGNTTVLTDAISDPKDIKTRDFTFDYSFWSHDGFDTDEAGYFKAADNKYADQQQVYDKVGVEILDNAWQGYHCCLFAYGQTGAGKSYSMIGYGANKGIVPISMAQIFERIKANPNPNQQFEVMFSMQEIYNEKIQDLLVAIKDRPAAGLKVREHQKLGVYVENLSKWPVDNYASIEAKMDEGNRNRTIGSTLMNASSSRAHTIITLEFKKIEFIDKKKTEKFSIINLVDLAGSEKLAKTGATGDRMKEGCSINVSLSTLGLVISKLAEKTANPKKNVPIPYRDSVLTRILQNALGGNSKTLMICALSPASDNYEETLSTLRYADQAKKIKNHAVINESEQDKMIRELKEENEKLKAMLTGGDVRVQGGDLMDDETMRKYKEMEEQLRENALLMQDMEKTYAQKIEEAKLKEKEEEMVNKMKPHLINLNEDPLLSHKIFYSLDKPSIYIGRKNGNPLPDIVLGGIGIKPNHALLTNVNGDIFVEACDEECAEYIYLNGERLLQKKQIFHHDRLIIGTNSIFLFKYPGRETESPNATVDENDIDWEFAQKEISSTMNKLKKMQNEQSEKEREVEVLSKIKEVEDTFKKQQEQKEELFMKQKEEFERKIKELEVKRKQEVEAQQIEMQKRETEREWNQAIIKYEAERLQKERERERMQKEIQDEAAIKRIREQEKNFVEDALAKYLAKITEINLIAKELKRNITFSVKLSYTFITATDLPSYTGNDKAHKPRMRILVDNKEQNCRYLWKLSKFSNRYYIIKDVLEKYYETNTLPAMNNINDPFWDPPEAHLIGQGFLSLQSLGYLIDNPAELSLVGDTGECGKIVCNLVPLDESGEPLGDRADYIEDPQELTGRKLDFSLNIEYATLPENFCQDTYCEYTLLCDDGSLKDFKTPTIYQKNSRPAYNYSFHHSFKTIDAKILNYLHNHYLCIKVYGYEIPEDNKGSFLSPDKSHVLSNSSHNQSQNLSEESGQKSSRRPKLEIQTEDTPQSSKGSTNTSYQQVSDSKPQSTSQARAHNPALSQTMAGTSSKLNATTKVPEQASTGGAAGTDKGKKKEDCTIF
jgi:hypothetical protein